MSVALHVERVGTVDAELLEGLAALLVDAVDGGASIGFHAPLPHRAALACARQVGAALDADNALWVARDDGGRIVGTVQMQRAMQENGRHRAEVCKLMVLRDARRGRIASQLMAALEAHAAAIGLALLVLDTQAQSPAEAFYLGQGWQRAGEIPAYASSASGALHATTLYFKRVEPVVA